MELSQINPYIRIATHSVLPAGIEIGPRIIFDYEMIYVENGEFTFYYNGSDYRCQKGNFIFIRPGISHRFFNIKQDVSQPHIHFDITYAKNSPNVPISYKDAPDLTDHEKSMIREDIFHAFPPNPFVSFHDKEAVLALFYRIIDTPPACALSQKAGLIQLLEQLFFNNYDDLLKDSITPYPVEKALKDFLDAGQGNLLCLDDIAKQFHYSKYYLDRKFQNQYGISIVAYRNQLRMQTARELLTQDSATIVSRKLGFSSIYVFSRAFKKYFGYPPSVVRNETAPLTAASPAQ